MTTEHPAAPATRSRRPSWRSPRLLVGVLLVVGSVVLGARLVAAADDSVGVWAVSRDLPAGAALSESDLEVHRVRFTDAATADRYLNASDELPAGATIARDLSAGELLPRAALADDTGRDLVDVPVSVAQDDVPATVRRGSRVDVWVARESPAGETGKAERVLADVTVVAAPQAREGLAPQATRQVILGVPRDRAGELGAALGRISGGRVVITRVG